MNRIVSPSSVCAIAFALFTVCGPSATALPSSSAQTITGLGTANFPTSTHSPEAQTAFMRGLLLLHVFEYPDAAKSFQVAEKLDPNFAMAYWGEAMTFNHPVWNELDAPAGQAALRKLGPTPQARSATLSDPRQQAFLGAVEILYDGIGTKQERDARYATAMQALAQTYPDDDEVQLFYSLALLGRSEGVRDVPTYLQAAAIAKAAFRRNPNHPGAAHYWIHGMDDPDHATGALEAARALSKIAPDAGHAQHMCSHIFMALGRWNDVVEANENAIRTVYQHARTAGRPILTCGHYVIWLQYAYYQQGRFSEANKLLSDCQSTSVTALAWDQAHPGQSAASSHAGGLSHQVSSSLVTMRGAAVIESRDWTGPAVTMTTVPVHDHSASQTGWNEFITGYAAAQSVSTPASSATSLAAADAALGKLSRIAAANPELDKETAAYLGILTDELGGLIASKRNDAAGALTQVQRAVATYDAMAFDFGPPPTFKPPQELLGELLLEDHKPQQAREAFQSSLKRAPGRAQSLLGLARAQTAAGDRAAADATYKQLLAIWKTADAGNQGLAEAQHFLAASSNKAASDSADSTIH